MEILNRKPGVAGAARVAAGVALAAFVLSAAGCTPPHRDDRVPPSSNLLAACPHGDAGRIKDAWLRPPTWWVCVR